MGSIPRIPTPAQKYIHTPYGDTDALTKTNRRTYIAEHARIFGDRPRGAGHTRKVYPRSKA